MFSTNLSAGEDGRRFLTRLVEPWKSSKFTSLTEKWLLPEHVHRVCKHGVGRPGSVRVLLHGDAALNKIHGGLQVAESFAALVFLRGHSTATRTD